jgi:transcriptional regulator with XRE-family HTH domain
VSTPQQAERIDAAIKARAEELRKTLDQVAAEAGITKQTLRAIRRGENRPFYKTANGIEDSLRWERGGLYALLDGGEPTALPDEPPASGEPVPVLIDPFEVQIRGLDHLTEDEQNEIIAEMRAEKARKLREARERGQDTQEHKGLNSA